MIVFVPAYDEATRANEEVAEQIVSPAALLLAREDARAAALRASLADDGARPLFAMAHGRADALLGQDGDIALDASDAAWLGGRSVFAFACNTARGLGPAAAAVDARFWGYEARVTAPDARPELLPVFADVFGFVLGSFADLRDADRAAAWLEDLAQRCERAAARIDSVLAAEAGLEPDACLLQLWQRLVLLTARVPALRHRGAALPFLE